MTVTPLRAYRTSLDLLDEARRGLLRLRPCDVGASGRLLVDLRPLPERLDAGEVPGALVVERLDLEFTDFGGPLVLLSGTGRSSSLAAASLARLGYSVADVVGGYAAWRDAGLRTVPGGMPAGRRTPTRAVVEVDASRWEVRLLGEPVPVTVQEFKVLDALVGAGGRVVTRAALAEQLEIYPATTRALDVHVCRLRRKLGPAADQLVTVRGVGWRFTPPSAD